MSVTSQSRICSSRVSENCGPIGIDSAATPPVTTVIPPSLQTRLMRSIAVSPVYANAAS
jgi:hypothetical protein